MRVPFWRRMSRRGRRTRILVVDKFVPDPTIGAGVPRMVEMLRSLAAAGADVDFWPMSRKAVGRFGLGDASAHGANIILDQEEGLARFLREHRGAFDGIIVSRPGSMAAFRRLLADHPRLVQGSATIYDAELLFAERERVMREVFGDPMPPSEARRRIDEELGLASDAKVVLAVSGEVAQAFATAGHRDVRVLGYALVPQPTPRPFEQREGFLFVGPTYDDRTPNTDSVVWFADHVLPRLRIVLKPNLSLMLVGEVRAAVIKARPGTIAVKGVQPELTEAYSQARVFVAPTRFAAGIPLKVYDAAARGVPVVLTPLLARQIGWRHEREVLVAETPEAFATACLRLHENRDLWHRLRAAALVRVAEDCGRERFDRVVESLVATIGGRAWA